MSIKDRLSLLQILPTQGSISEMVDMFDLARELKLSDDEKGLVNYIETDSAIKWNYDKDPNKQINLTRDQLKVLKAHLDTLDKKKQIPLTMIELIMKIYGEYKELDTTHS